MHAEEELTSKQPWLAFKTFDPSAPLAPPCCYCSPLPRLSPPLLQMITLPTTATKSSVSQRSTPAQICMSGMCDRYEDWVDSEDGYLVSLAVRVVLIAFCPFVTFLEQRSCHR
ncbi:hypothetical protein J6590_046536 [Homalodisca vitripennis]|nr:hypothetical protein J6590_046536 [Homalodisca vitripennis]